MNIFGNDEGYTNPKLLIPLKITEELEYHIQRSDSKEILESHIIRPTHTVTAWGKHQVCRCVASLSNYRQINEMRVKYNGNWTTVAVSIVNGTKYRTNNTLVCKATFSTAGTYGTIRCSHGSEGDANYHNEIFTTVSVSAGQEVVFYVKFGFSGLNNFGNEITASRYGMITDTYDYELSTLQAYYDATSEYEPLSFYSESPSNTLLCECTFTAAHTYHTMNVKIAVAGHIYHKFTGQTIQVNTGQELGVTAEFVYD